MYFITIDKRKAATNRDAREQALRWVGSKANKHYYEHPSMPGLTDWFVVGGRWSGHLQMRNRPLWKEINRSKDIKFEIVDGYRYLPSDEVDEKKTVFQKLWRGVGGEGICPLLRNTTRDEGYEDDAMIVTHELYRRILEYFCRKSRGKMSFFCDGFTKNGNWIDINGDTITKKFIGKKWLVLLDCHS